MQWFYLLSKLSKKFGGQNNILVFLTNKAWLISLLLSLLIIYCSRTYTLYSGRVVVWYAYCTQCGIFCVGVLEDEKWNYVEPPRATRNNMEPRGTAWNNLEPRATAWNNVEPRVATWNHVESHRTMWSNVEPRGATRSNVEAKEPRGLTRSDVESCVTMWNYVEQLGTTWSH